MTIQEFESVRKILKHLQIALDECNKNTNSNGDNSMISLQKH